MAAREIAAPLPQPADGSSSGVVRSGAWWPVSLGVLTISLAALCFTFRADATAAVSLWITIPTYNYCFLIPLISFYLIWRQRAEIACSAPSPSLFGVALLACFAAVWWLASALLIAEIRQLAIVGMIQGLALGVLGPRLYRRLMFPLLYLFLMVPTGTVLLSPLQNLSAIFSGGLLRMVGIPVFIDGVVLEVPHGVYLIAPGCAGLNFLLAALSLSLLFGQLVYTGTVKRSLSVAVALVVSILANQVRIFGIIWIAEITNRQVDIVNDHLIYGWILFSLIILGGMAVGLRFADPPTPPHPPAAAAPVPRFGLLLTVWVAMLAVAGGAQAAALPFIQLPATTHVAIDLPATVGAWRRVAPDDRWSPAFPQADAQRRVAYVKGNQRVEVFVAYYWRQGDGHKATNTANDLAGQWTALSHEKSTMPGAVPMTVDAVHLGRTAAGHRLVWSWYWLAGRRTADPWRARLLGVLGHLTGDARAAVIAVAADELPDAAAAEAVLADFLTVGDGLGQALQQAHLTSD
jgi:exosortase A